jgi:hypothetical protein
LRTLLRPGPVPLPGDSWDVVPSDAQPSPRPASNHRRRWSPRTIGILAVAIGVVVVAGIWLLPVAALPRSYGGPSGAGTDPDNGRRDARGSRPGRLGRRPGPRRRVRGRRTGDRRRPGRIPAGRRLRTAGRLGSGSRIGVHDVQRWGTPVGRRLTDGDARSHVRPVHRARGTRRRRGLPADQAYWGRAEVVASPAPAGRARRVCYIGDLGHATPGSLQCGLNIPATGNYRVAVSYVAEGVTGRATLVGGRVRALPGRLPAGSQRHRGDYRRRGR